MKLRRTTHSGPCVLNIVFFGVKLNLRSEYGAASDGTWGISAIWVVVVIRNFNRVSPEAFERASGLTAPRCLNAHCVELKSQSFYAPSSMARDKSED